MYRPYEIPMYRYLLERIFLEQANDRILKAAWAVSTVAGLTHRILGTFHTSDVPLYPTCP